MDSTRRTLLTTGAAAAAAAAAPRAFAQAPGKAETGGTFYQRGNVRIRYEETGSGFPLLILPGGGQNATIEWGGEERAVQRDGGIQNRIPLHHR